MSHNGVNVTSLQAEGQPVASDSQRQRAVLSRSEQETVKSALASNFELVFASGAGYKLLATVSGLVDVYVLSHHSVYRWDCCAVHAILQALGGGVISFKHALRAVRDCPEGLSCDTINKLQLSYIKASGAILSRRDSVSDDNESLPGIIAYRSLGVVNTVLNVLKTAVSVE